MDKICPYDLLISLYLKTTFRPIFLKYPGARASGGETSDLADARALHRRVERGVTPEHGSVAIPVASSPLRICEVVPAQVELSLQVLSGEVPRLADGRAALHELGECLPSDLSD